MWTDCTRPTHTASHTACEWPWLTERYKTESKSKKLREEGEHRKDISECFKPHEARLLSLSVFSGSSSRHLGSSPFSSPLFVLSLVHRLLYPVQISETPFGLNFSWHVVWESFAHTAPVSSPCPPPRPQAAMSNFLVLHVVLKVLCGSECHGTALSYETTCVGSCVAARDSEFLWGYVRLTRWT